MEVTERKENLVAGACNKYADTHSNVYRRIEMIAKIDEQLRVLDLKECSQGSC